MSHHNLRSSACGAALLAALLILPGSAFAATPSVNTGPAVNVTATGAQLRGAVDPNGEDTTYHFEFGPTTDYGSSTKSDTATGNGGRTVRSTVDSLTPGTTYHYRVVATNGSGTIAANDRSFTTRTPFTFTARRLAVGFAETPSFTGTLAGATVANRKVGLEARPYPFSANFAAVGNPGFTDDQGKFTLTAPPALMAMQYRVTTFDTPPSTSTPLTVGVRVRVRTFASHTKVNRGSKVRFYGTVTPAHDKEAFAIQKRKDGHWVTVAGGLTTHQGNGQRSAFSKSVTVLTSGRYRVYVKIDDNDHLPRGGRGIIIHVRK